jgi:hypothetical protein
VPSLLFFLQVMINDRHCFELYGFDVIIDDTLRPWLIEVCNRSALQYDCCQYTLRLHPAWARQYYSGQTA